MSVNVSASPHQKSEKSTRELMIDVLIALIPTTFFGIKNFGAKALVIVIVCIVVSVGCEAIFNVICKRKQTIDDCSALLTGLLIALNMPASIPIFIPVVACVFGIVVAKMLYGGLGQNFLNPALAGRCFVSISFASQMNTFVYDGVTSATPLAVVDSGVNVDLAKMTIGFIPGTIGEVSKIAILIGLVYLLARRVISFRIPFVYIVSFMLVIILCSGRASDTNYILSQLLGGGVLFGAVFMATDYVTSPMTDLGQILYALFIGVVNAVFRLWGNTTEGCSFSILLGNLLVPFFDSFTMKRALGR